MQKDREKGETHVLPISGPFVEARRRRASKHGSSEKPKEEIIKDKEAKSEVNGFILF